MGPAAPAHSMGNPFYGKTSRLFRDHYVATWSALVTLTLVAFLLRTPQLDAQSLWRDEVDVIRLAGESTPHWVRQLVRPGHNGPLYYLLMQGWLSLTGRSEFALRYISLSFGVLVIPLVYRTGKRLVGRQAALLAAALAAVSPYLVWYSRDAKMYALLTALTLLAMACILEALATSRLRWWVGFLLFASLSLYIHMLSAPMIPVYAALFLLARPLSSGQWRRAAVAFGLLTLPYLPLAVWQLPMVLDAYDTGHPYYPISQILSVLFNLYARGVSLVGNWIVLAGFVFAMLSGLFLPIPGRPRRGDTNSDAYASGGSRWRVFLVIWLLLPILLVFLISLRAPVFEPRYLIYVAPAFYLLTGLGIVALSRLSWVPAGLALAIVLSFSLLGVWVQATTPINSDFRAAAGYVMTRRENNAPIMFQMPYARRTFDYYFDAEYEALEGPWTNGGESETQVDDFMARLLAPHAEVWLVASESWLWDSRSLTQAWLDGHAQLVESARFTLVDVYHYRLQRKGPGN